MHLNLLNSDLKFLKNKDLNVVIRYKYEIKSKISNTSNTLNS